MKFKMLAFLMLASALILVGVCGGSSSPPAPGAFGPPSKGIRYPTPPARPKPPVRPTPPARHHAMELAKSLDGGFRGVPWGLEIREAERYELEFFGNANAVSQFVKIGENLSLGKVPLKTIYYLFNFLKKEHVENGMMFFNGVMLVAGAEYRTPLSEECLNLFGKPSLSSDRVLEWDLANVKVTFSTNRTEATVVIEHKNKDTPPQTGGGL